MPYRSRAGNFHLLSLPVLQTDFVRRKFGIRKKLGKLSDKASLHPTGQPRKRRVKQYSLKLAVKAIGSGHGNLKDKYLATPEVLTLGGQVELQFTRGRRMGLKSICRRHKDRFRPAGTANGMTPT